jgi:hypothetical protein
MITRAFWIAAIAGSSLLNFCSAETGGFVHTLSMAARSAV